MRPVSWVPARSANEKFPELKTMETLPAHEMAVRLCFLFDHYDKHPVREDLHGCVPILAHRQLIGKHAQGDTP